MYPIMKWLNRWFYEKHMNPCLPCILVVPRCTRIWNLTNGGLNHALIPNDANLVITWSRNPHVKTPISGKPSKSGLIGVWHKDNLYLGTITIGNRDPHPMNIDSQTRSIRMTSWRQNYSSISRFQFFREPRKGDYPTNTK